MPSVSAAQHRAMESAAHGKSTLGIPKKVGKEFVAADAALPIAAGTAFVSPEGKVLLLKRAGVQGVDNYVGHWSLPGGKGEPGETPEQTADRESAEELGNTAPISKKKLLDRVKTPNGMVFHTFAQPVHSEFQPQLNEEHSECGWFSVGDLPKPLHPSVGRVLRENLGVEGAEDMAPEDWDALRTNFAKWTREEEAEPEHAEDINAVVTAVRNDEGVILLDTSDGKTVELGRGLVGDNQPMLATTINTGIPLVDGMKKKKKLAQDSVCPACKGAGCDKCGGSGVAPITKIKGGTISGPAGAFDMARFMRDLAGDEGFNEGDHPRAPDGKFGSGSSSSSKGKTDGSKGKEAKAPLKMSALQKKGGKLGSNEGGLYEGSAGEKFYIKKPGSKAHVANERMAASLYALAGAKTLDYRDVEGGEHVASEWKQLEKKNIRDFTPAERKEAAHDFAIHAWLSNWDAAGTGGDNQGVLEGKTTTLDVGGSLRFRAQGGPKGSAFGDKVIEWDSMRNKGMSPDAAKLFAPMSESELKASVERVTAIPDAKIRAAVGDDKELADRLIARKKDLASKVGLAMDEWNEGDHPREDDGKFGSGGSGKSTAMTPQIEAEIKVSAAKMSKLFQASIGSKPTEAEKTALTSYADEGHKKINGRLRGKLASMMPLSSETKALDSLIGRCKLSENVTTYRGIPDSVAQGLIAEYNKDKLPEFGDKGFTSVSASEREASNFGKTILQLDLPKGTAALPVPAGGEEEIILPRNSRFRVTGVVRNKIIVELVKNSDGARDALSPMLKALLRREPELAFDRAMFMLDDGLCREGMAFDYAQTSVRSIDADGRMHIEVSNISKATVNPYMGKEIPKYRELNLLPDKIYYLLRDPAELEKAASTFNNLPLLDQHVGVNAANHRPEHVVGSTGTDAEFTHPHLKNSLVIWADRGIKAVENKKKKELSSAYRYRADMTPGDFEGVRYDGVMRDIVGNHVALVEEGRAGSDVVVGDSLNPLIKEMTMKALKLSALGTVAYGSLMTFLRPQLAQDTKFDLKRGLRNINAKNFKAKRPTLAAWISESVKDKLDPEYAQDGALNSDGLDAVLDMVELACDDFPDDMKEKAKEKKDDDKAKDEDMSDEDADESAEDEAETDEEKAARMKAREAAKDKKAKDAKKGKDGKLVAGAKDKDVNEEDEEHDPDKMADDDADADHAMDERIEARVEARIKQERDRMDAIMAAKDHVRARVGSLPNLAFDSAAGVYAKAVEMETGKKPPKDAGLDMLKFAFDNLPSKDSGKKRTYAMDSANGSRSAGGEIAKRNPKLGENMARIQRQ